MDVAQGLGDLIGDPRKIKQILYNLISNAVKFSHDGGLVTLRAKRVPASRAGRHIGGWPRLEFPLAGHDFGETLEISVIDAGIGISVEDVDRLFQPFSQIDRGLARRFEGTGPGLAMTKLLAELHGGTVAVESAAHEGSRFTVWLPFRSLADDGGRVASTPAPDVRAAPGSHTAMVVEGDPKSAGLIYRILLQAHRYQTCFAEDAALALSVAHKELPDLIILDLGLPAGDGFVVLERLAKVAELRSIPVIVVSARDHRNNEERALEAGARAYMQKPWDDDSLLALISHLLGEPAISKAVAR